MEKQKEDFLKNQEKIRVSNLTEFFKMLGNPTRIRILCFLKNREACVTEIAKQLELTQSTVSHQLNLLRFGKLVRQRRAGKTIIYSLNSDHILATAEKGMDFALGLKSHSRKK